MRSWLSGIVCAVVCAGIGPAVHAQSKGEPAVVDRLEEVASSFTKDNAFMGTVLVVKGDDVLLNRGYGKADVEWNIPNEPDAKFRLGSLTKQFTATLVLQLQQEGKLNIDDPVSKYLPDTPKAWENITLANLLGHTSGIPNFTSFKEFGTWRMSAHTPQEELEFFKGKPLDFEPGTKFEYSNSNYEVLGNVIERVTGKKYAVLLQERIFDRVGMKDTGLDRDDLVLQKRAEGYQRGPNGLEVARSESMSVPWAAGSIYSTSGDLLKWEHALFGGEVLSADSLKRMTTPSKGNYGLGVFIEERSGTKVITHGGGIEGFNTSLSYAPDKKIAVIVLGNVNGGAPDDMGKKLMDVVLGVPVVLASERKAEPISRNELPKYEGVYVLHPGFDLTVAMGKDGLTVQGTGQPAIPVQYEGRKRGHAFFFSPDIDAEIEFVPDAAGKIESVILHQNERDMPAKRK